MVGKTRARRRVGQEQQGKAPLHRLAVTRGGNGPGRVIKFARGPEAGIPDIDVQAQIGVRRPLSQRAEAYLVGIGRRGAACRDSRQKKKQQRNEEPDVAW